MANTRVPLAVAGSDVEAADPEAAGEGEDDADVLEAPHAEMAVIIAHARNRMKMFLHFFIFHSSKFL